MKGRRKKYLVNRPYQFGLLGLLLSIVFIAIFISIITTHYFVLSTILTKIEETGTFPLGTELIDNSVKPLVIIVPIVFIILAFTFLYILFISHRTAGPLYRLAKAMEKVGKGDLSVRVTFRKSDEVYEVAETFNQMVEGLKKRFAEHKKTKRK